MDKDLSAVVQHFLSSRSCVTDGFHEDSGRIHFYVGKLSAVQILYTEVPLALQYGSCILDSWWSFEDVERRKRCSLFLSGPISSEPERRCSQLHFYRGHF